jgi:predicted ATP-dependent endonuclease of OLD family
MIKSVTLLKGQKTFTNKLYHHKNTDVTFNFVDGINVITGRNGSGKSVLLKIIKTNCGIEDNSYPRMFSPMDLTEGFFLDKKLTIQEVIAKKLENSELPNSKIEWDGSMVHYLTPDFFDPDDMFSRMDSPLPRGKELFSFGDVVMNMVNKNKNSKGESCIQLLNKIYELHTDYDPPLKNVNEVWMEASNTFQEWIGSFSNEGGKPTLLIDELDSHLDLDNQKTYWDYINLLTKKWQVIVVSHSIFSFKLDNVNHIPLNKEYFNNVRKLLK